MDIYIQLRRGCYDHRSQDFQGSLRLHRQAFLLLLHCINPLGTNPSMTALPHNDTSVMEEKEAAQTTHLEDVAESSTLAYEQAEMEPRMNLQTCLAFLVHSHLSSTVLFYRAPSRTLTDSRLLHRSTMLMSSPCLFRRLL